jgi:hypothetical protein
MWPVKATFTTAIQGGFAHLENPPFEK